jgi:hypothetical protein
MLLADGRLLTASKTGQRAADDFSSQIRRARLAFVRPTPNVEPADVSGFANS